MAFGQIATVDMTSEDPDFPINSAASEEGEQQIRIIFEHPVGLPARRIQRDEMTRRISRSVIFQIALKTVL